jgi:hypothetical protein
MLTKIMETRPGNAFREEFRALDSVGGFREAISCSNEEMGWQLGMVTEHRGKHLFFVASG